MKPRNKNPRSKPRRAPTPEEHAAATQRYLDRVDRQILRAVQEWARTWEDYVLPACRRNKRCLHEDACRMHRDEPWTEEDSRWVREWLDNMSDKPAPKYDGDKVR